MTARSLCIGWMMFLATWVAVPAASAPWAAAADSESVVSPSEVAVVDLFAGIESGRIEARLIARDSTRCNLLVTNKTDQPISVALPASFAGVPVLAQFFDPQAQQQQQRPQALGLSRPPRQNNQWPDFGPMFNIAPEKVARVELAAVCLEYGKPDPQPKHAYELKPLHEVTQTEGIAEICEMLGRGEITQRAAQLAAWHLNNDMSWARLTGMRRRASIGTVAVFGRTDLQAARKAAEQAVALAQERHSPSLNQSAAN